MTTARTTRLDHPRVAILVVNGFDRRGRWGQYNETEALNYPWVDLCLCQIARHSKGWDYEVFVFDNSHLKSHRTLMNQYPRVHVLPRNLVAVMGRIANRIPMSRVGGCFERFHPKALDHLVSQVPSDFSYIVTLDTDSFPVREDWLGRLVGECERGAAVAGVHRNEMVPTIRPFIHVSGLCVRRHDLQTLGVSFGRRMGQDVAQNITDEFRRAGRMIAPLERSNAVNFHFLIGGVYGDVIYHHGAGSRRAEFWTTTDQQGDERVSATLRDAAFEDIDHLIAVLRGRAANDLGLKAI
jgi:hypothetical protein